MFVQLRKLSIERVLLLFNILLLLSLQDLGGELRVRNRRDSTFANEGRVRKKRATARYLLQITNHTHVVSIHHSWDHWVLLTLRVAMASGDYIICSIPAAVNSTIKDEITELRAMMKGLALDDFPPCPRGEGEPRESRCGITALQYLSFNTRDKGHVHVRPRSNALPVSVGNTLT
jgi:hypothetical protein